MKVRTVLTLAMTVALVGVAWATIGVRSSVASQDAGVGVTGTDALTAMHEACVSNNVSAMHGIMESATGEDWNTMEFHMGPEMMGPQLMGPAMGAATW